MAQRNPTKITTELAVDDPLIQNARFEMDADDRQYLDNQIRGVQQHLVDALIRGKHATYVRVAASSATIRPGYVACLASLDEGEPQITLALASPLGDAIAAFGVVVFSAAPGSMALVAFGGVLPPTLTGLAKNAAGFVRVNTTTGALERVLTLGAGDYGVGAVDKAGYMLVVPGIGAANTVGAAFIAGGDLAGTSSSQTVIGIQGIPVDDTGPAEGQVPKYDSGTNTIVWVDESAGGGTFYGSVITLNPVGGLLDIAAHDTEESPVATVNITDADANVTSVNGIDALPGRRVILQFSGGGTIYIDGGLDDDEQIYVPGGSPLVVEEGGSVMIYRSVSLEGPVEAWGVLRAAAPASGGEANVGANLGTGSDIYASKSGVTLQFKRLQATLPLDINASSGTNLVFGLGGLTGFGSVGQSTRVAAGGTSLEWFTPSSGATVGSADQIQTTDGSGGTRRSAVRAGNNAAWLSLIASGTPSSFGIELARAHILQWLNNAGTADLNEMQVDTSDNLIIGDNANGGDTTLRAKTGKKVALSTGGTDRFKAEDSVNTSANPIDFSAGATTAGTILRVPATTARAIVGGTGTFFGSNSGTEATLFCDTSYGNGYATGRIYPSSTLVFGIGGSNYIAMFSSLVQYGVPRIGNATPYASEGLATPSVTGSRSATASEYSRRMQKISFSAGSATTLTYPMPSSADATYTLDFEIPSVTGSSSSLTISNGGAATVNFTPGGGTAGMFKRCTVEFRTTGAHLKTPVTEFSA